MVSKINEQGGVSHVETANVETRKANRKESGWVASRQDSQHCHARTRRVRVAQGSLCFSGYAPQDALTISV